MCLIPTSVQRGVPILTMPQYPEAWETLLKKAVEHQVSNLYLCEPLVGDSLTLGAQSNSIFRSSHSTP